MIVVTLAGCSGGTEVGNPGPSGPVAVVDLEDSSAIVEIVDEVELVDYGETDVVTLVLVHAILSDRDRVVEPEAVSDDLFDQVAGNRDFAFHLYHAIRSEDGNLLFSPYGISLSLAMVYAGARYDTEAQMAEALRFVLGQDRLHPVFNALDRELSSRGQDIAGEDGKAFRLSVVNGIWGQTGYGFAQDYLDILTMHYDAGVNILDLGGHPERSRLVINEFVANQTDYRILDLLPEGSIDEDTRLVLTNAVYFSASWQQAFDPESTKPGGFHPTDGTAIEAQMMSQEMERIRHAEGEGYQVVELPYVKDEFTSGGRLSMMVIVPDQGLFDAVESALSGVMLQAILGRLEHKRVTLTIPKFEFDAELGLRDALYEMGLTDAFDVTLADFSGISESVLPDLPLFLEDVVHKAYVKVDEAGTEAAASSGIVLEPPSPHPPEAVTLVVDRPFIFLIRDHDTGAVLFIGRVLDPTP